MDELILTNKTKLKNIAKKYNLAVLILFGSRANNTAIKTSDYDLAYFSHKPLKNEKFKLLTELEIILKNVDLIELNTTPSILLRYEIFENGICIYEEKLGLFDELEGNAYIDYMDNITYFNEYETILTNSIKEL